MKFLCVLLIIYFVLTSIVTKGFPNNDIFVFRDNDYVSTRNNQKVIQSDNGDRSDNGDTSDNIEYRSFMNVKRKCPENYIKRSGICVPKKCPKNYILVGSFCFSEDR